MKKSWYCYICGRKIEKNYFLCSLAKSTDRVFLICDKRTCVEQIDREYNPIIIKVKEENK